MSFNIQDWYWIVTTNPTQVWAGARGIYVATSDSAYVTWDAIAGNDATPIATEAELQDVIAQAALTYYVAGNGYGSETLDGSADHTLTNPLKTVYFYDPDAGGRALTLPAMNLPNSRPIGVPFYIFNLSSTNTFTVFYASSGSTAIAKSSLNTFINESGGFATPNGIFSTSRAPIFSGTAAPLNVDIDGTLAANSDTLIATQKAVKTYADLRALSSRQIIAGTGLTGGGNLTTDRTVALSSPVAANLGGTGIVNNVASTTTIIGSFGITYTVSGTTTLTLPASGTVLINARQVISGGGLTGGGDLSADRTLAVGAGTGITVNADDVALNISGLTADATPDVAADYVATYDASATTHKKVLLSNLPSSGALASEPFVTIGNTAGLSAERSLVATAPVTLTDAGANSTATIAVSAATTSASGVSELATDAETVTGTDTVRTTTPSNLVAKMAAPGAIGGTTPAAGSFTTASASTSSTSPLVIGGSGTTGTQLTLQSTTGNGTTDTILVKRGNNGGTTAVTINSDGVGFNTTPGATTGIDILPQASGTGLRIRGRAADEIGTIQFATSNVSAQNGKIQFDNTPSWQFYNGTTQIFSLTNTKLAVDVTTASTTTTTGALTVAGGLGVAGAVNAGAGTFTSITTTGNTILGDAGADTVVINAKSITKPNGVIVSAYNSASDNDVTGDGTVATIDFDTEVFDRGGDFSADTFTAPVTGAYRISGNVILQGLTAATHVITISVVTTGKTYTPFIEVSTTGTQSIPFSVIVSMTAADTMTVTATVTGGTKVVDVYGNASPGTFVSIELVG